MKKNKKQSHKTKTKFCVAFVLQLGFYASSAAASYPVKVKQQSNLVRISGLTHTLT